MEENKIDPKKKKKVKYILLFILLLILAAVIAAAVYFYSLWRTAKRFEKELDLAHFFFAVDVELEQEGLTGEQLALIDSLAGISGLKRKTFLKLRIEGSVWEDKVYAEIFPAGSSDPLTEVYLSSGDDFVNISPLYDSIRSELVRRYARYAPLDGLLPVIGGDCYMTLEHVEELTGGDLSSIRNFEPSFSQYDLSAVEYFAALAVLPFIEHEKGSALTLKAVKEPIGVDGRRAVLYFEMEQPAQVVERNVEKYGDILSQLNINIDGSSFKALKRLAVTMGSEGVQEIAMPENVIGGALLDILGAIRELFDASTDLATMSSRDIMGLLYKLPSKYPSVN